MEWEDEALVLSARIHGETGAIVELLTEQHGKFAAHVAGAASRRMKPFLQPGSRVIARYRARMSDQLGAATLEPMGEGVASLFDDPLALAGLSSAASLAAGALPEREAHPGAFHALEALIGVLQIPDIWPAVYVRYEAGLLQELGFGLDLSKCAATGSFGPPLLLLLLITGDLIMITRMPKIPAITQSLFWFGASISPRPICMR